MILFIAFLFIVVFVGMGVAERRLLENRRDEKNYADMSLLDPFLAAHVDDYHLSRFSSDVAAIDMNPDGARRRWRIPLAEYERLRREWMGRKS